MRTACVVLLIGALGASASAGEFSAHGIGWLRGVDVRSQPSWLEGGFGRLTEGAASPRDSDQLGLGQAQLALEWAPSLVFRVYAHGLARYEGEGAKGEHFGLTEAYAEYAPQVSDHASLRFRAGLFFPPTSRENVDPLWASPYTLTYSALNTWIGEELRLTGIETACTAKTSGGSELQLAASGFGVDDGAGALLAWRGWGMGDRLVVVGETLPLPPLRTLQPGGGFADQRSDGDRPIAELDNRIGWQVRGRWRTPDRVLVQAAYLDSRGDLNFYRGQYAWRTEMVQLGAELHLPGRVRIIAEGAKGSTAMGDEADAQVDLHFETGYVLLTWGSRRLRLSLRYDTFRNQDHDGTQEPDQESGHAWTGAVLWSPVPHLRLGAELLDLDGLRPAAADSGADPDAGARRLMGEVRFTF